MPSFDLEPSPSVYAGMAVAALIQVNQLAKIQKSQSGVATPCIPGLRGLFVMRALKYYRMITLL